MNKTLEVLKKAREIIKTSPTTGHLCDTSGRYCALGAIGSAMGIKDADLIDGGDDVYEKIGKSEAAEEIAKAIKLDYNFTDAYGSGHHNDTLIYLYNDRIGRQHAAKVVNIFDRAIEALTTRDD